jgi:neutral ceramidase
MELFRGSDEVSHRDLSRVAPPGAMRPARAGFGKVEISTRATGAGLIGYANRRSRSVAVHDSLFVRALVVEAAGRRIALCSVDLCCVNEDVVAAARELIADRTSIPAEHAFIAATHSHSAPADNDAGCWPDGLHSHISAAVEQAVDRLAPARIGAGWGAVHGHSLNRRRLEDPVDPAVFVMRVDHQRGATMGVYYSFGCHPVVLGPDNLHVSADWPGVCSEVLESSLGPGAVAVFGQGACGDVNPITPDVLERMDGAETVTGEVAGTHYYGRADLEPTVYEIGDRSGGTFVECGGLGRAVADEVLRIYRGTSAEEVTDAWARSVSLPAGDPSRAAGAGPLGGHAAPRAGGGDPIEVMVVGIEGPGVLILGEPGEVFANTGAGLRRKLRAAGVTHPVIVGYANGWRAYLPPRSAYSEGGYEVDWATETGIPESLQDDIGQAVVNDLNVRRSAD